MAVNPLDALVRAELFDPALAVLMTRLDTLLRVLQNHMKLQDSRKLILTEMNPGLPETARMRDNVATHEQNLQRSVGLVRTKTLEALRAKLEPLVSPLAIEAAQPSSEGDR